MGENETESSKRSMWTLIMETAKNTAVLAAELNSIVKRLDEWDKRMQTRDNCEERHNNERMRLDDHEGRIKELEKAAVNAPHDAEKRIDALEKAPGRAALRLGWLVIGAIATSTVGGLIGFAISKL